jgi:hypothetical protein
MQKKHPALEPIEPEMVNNINSVHKQNMLDAGYLPYRATDGRIKWLNKEQHSYKMMKGIKPNPISRYLGPSYKPHSRRRRKHRPVMFKFLRANLGFVTIIVVVLVLVLIALKYGQLLIDLI